MQCCDCLKGVFVFTMTMIMVNIYKKMHQTMCPLGLGSMVVLYSGSTI